MTATATAPRHETEAPAMPTPASSPAVVAFGKMMTARKELAATMIEREEEIDLCLTALVAGEHVLFVGPPGTGKSMLCDAVSGLIHGRKFGYLMTKFTTPEEVLGPISLTQLKADKYVRVTADKLPEADTAFLDEIFKSSSAILNTLLKILNERLFNDGTGEKRVPLRLCIAASNEWPTQDGQQELGALFDRFVLRRTVHPVRTAAGKEKLWFGAVGAPRLSVTISGAELDAARSASQALPWTPEAKEAFATIIRELNKQGVMPGDRRQRKAVGIAQAAAWMDGSPEVKAEHLGILADCLWDDPQEQPRKCAEVVARVANPTAMQVNALLVETEEVLAATDVKDLKSATAGAAKLAEIAKKLGRMKGNPKADKAVSYVAERVRDLKRMAMESV